MAQRKTLEAEGLVILMSPKPEESRAVPSGSSDGFGDLTETGVGRTIPCKAIVRHYNPVIITAVFPDEHRPRPQLAIIGLAHICQWNSFIPGYCV